MIRKLRKNAENARCTVVTFVLISMVLSGVACETSTPSGPAIDTGDAKRAAEKIAEAETLYEGREEITKARVAVAALRQAQTADYGNYEAAWKLARAAFYVGDRTDNDSERDDMFREGTEAGKAAVKLQPDKPDGHFWLGANYGGTAAHSTLANLSSFKEDRKSVV